MEPYFLVTSRREELIDLVFEGLMINFIRCAQSTSFSLSLISNSPNRLVPNRKSRYQ